MEIHIRPKPIVVVLFPDLLKDIQRRGDKISSKCGDNTFRKTVRNYRLE